MSRFLSARMEKLTPYVPGEQPRERKFIKLNTNESPFPPPQSVLDVIASTSRTLNLYSDPQATELRAAIAEYHGVAPENISVGNGSDETLSFIFVAFCDETHPVAFPNITYGFYPVFADFYGIPYREIPVLEDLSVNVGDYFSAHSNIVVANPNAPTGIALSPDTIGRIAKTNPDNIVVIDEAYADFSGKTAIPLTAKFDNLIVVRTFSKSRFLAGARLGYAVANSELIADIERVRYSFNPYNVNSLTLAAGAQALRENDYYSSRWAEIVNTREKFKFQLESLGFEVTNSEANFVFANFPGIEGKRLNALLREEGFLVRSQTRELNLDWLRITIGAAEDMDKLALAIKKIMSR